MRVLMIGAHQDDCEFCCGGFASKLVKNGHTVKFLSMCNGSGGHHIMTPEETTATRAKESAAVAKLLGITYDVWDVADCNLVADLPTRKRLIRYIRAFNPDLVIAHRPNDYHADHRNAALLMQDASYLLIVPHFCPDVPAMKKTPVIMYCYDGFQNPPFQADVVVAIDDVLDRKIEMLACHESQLFEWLPYTNGILDQVPEGREERIEWLHGPRIPRDGRFCEKDILSAKSPIDESEYREAIPAIKYRKKLIERYGEDKGRAVLFAEAFAVCEYGSPLTKEIEMEYIPL